MPFQATLEHGSDIYRHISILRYESVFAFRLAGETHTNCLTDLLAFSLIVYFAARSNMIGSGIPTLLGIIVKDATVYFLFIFTSHLVLELTLVLGRVGIYSRRLVLSSFLRPLQPTIQLLPAT